MRGPTVAVVLASLVASTLALAEEDAGAPAPPVVHGAQSRWCTDTAHVQAVDALRNQNILERLTTLLAATVLSTRKDLQPTLDAIADVRDGIIEVHCTEGLLSPPRRAAAQAFEARATKVTADLSASIAAEQQDRDAIVVPLCLAHWGLDQARATIAHERSNPAGVVDPRVLHDAGEAVQQYQAQIAVLNPAYVALRKHAFNGWQSEVACTGEVAVPQQ